MQPKDVRKITVTVTRFLKFFAALWTISQVVFYFAKLDDHYLTVTETYITPALFGWICVGMLLLSFATFIKLAILYEEPFRARYLEGKENGKNKLLVLLGDPAFWIRVVLFVLLFWILPFGAFPAFKTLALLFFPEENGKLYVTLILFAALFLMTLHGYLKACKEWDKGEGEFTAKAYNRKFRTSAIIYMIGGIVGSYVIPQIIPLFVNLPKLFADPSMPFVISVILFVALGLFCVKYGRRILGRRRFLKKLYRCAKENKSKLSAIGHPYASLFRHYTGESFSVSCDGKQFSCLMLCGRNAREPLVFDEEGWMEFTFSASVLGYDLFQYKKRLEFDYHSEYKKVIIMSSMPKKVVLNWESKQIPLESGDRFGSYIFYNETDFLNALNRDVLGR